jgi:hypothetical protein
MAENDMIKALDRWEGEGGSDLPGDDLAETERLVLMALGAAVVAEWNTLGIDVQREVFRPAANEASATILLREQIALTLHDDEGYGVAA